MKYNVTERKRNGKLQVILSYKVQKDMKWKQKAKSFELDDITGKNNWVNETIKIMEQPTDTLEVICKDFLDKVKLYREYKTYANYVTVVNHMKPYMHLQASTITSKHIQELVDNLYLKDYKASTVACYTTRIRSILNYYKRTYNSNYNLPASSFFTCIKKEKIEHVSVDVKEILEWTKSNFTYQEYLIVLVAIKTGMRKSEIFGLTTDCIYDDYIEVKHQLKKNYEGKLALGSLKTTNSYRKVPISKKLQKMLVFHSKTAKNNMVFNLNIYTFANNYCKKLKRKYGINFHFLRHIFISRLIELNIDYTTISNLAGHNAKQTMLTYGHMNDSMYNKVKEVILFDKIFD